MATRFEMLKNYVNSVRKIRKNSNYLYNLQILGLTCFPNNENQKALIYRIEGDIFKYVRYDFKQSSDAPVKIFFSETKPVVKRYSVENEIKRTLKYVYKYVKKHDIENLVYSKGHPLTVLTPIMLSVGDDIEIIKNALNNNIHPYTLAKMVQQGYSRDIIFEAILYLNDDLITKTYL